MMDYIKSLIWVDYFYYTLVEPRRLINIITKEEKKTLPLSISVVAAVSIIEIITISLLGKEDLFFYYKITYGWILAFFILSLIIAITASLVDLACQIRGYNGNAKNIINVIIFSLFPRIFLLPIVIIFKVLHFAPIFFYLFSSILVFIWQALIIIQGISEIHRISFAESVMIFLSPIIFISAILFFSLFLIIINISGYISLL
ncbi:MAG: YIP1 family protein [Spirochaetota bacterium]|nr:YIP1 family protein [Spirochaetota bacterium]